MANIDPGQPIAVRVAKPEMLPGSELLSVQDRIFLDRDFVDVQGSKMANNCIHMF